MAAREIKITNKGVRGIPDTQSKGEHVIAARWQDDDGVKTYALSREAEAELERQSGAPIVNPVSRETFMQYLEDNWA